MSQGINASNAASEFLQHAADERGHADRIAATIVPRQGVSNLDPDGLTTRSHAEYIEGTDLVGMIREDLVAERIAIASYNEIIWWLGDKDVTTRRLMKDILAVEEEHADDLLTLLQSGYPGRSRGLRESPGASRERGPHVGASPQSSGNCSSVRPSQTRRLVVRSASLITCVRW